VLRGLRLFRLLLNILLLLQEPLLHLLRNGGQLLLLELSLGSDGLRLLDKVLFELGLMRGLVSQGGVLRYLLVLQASIRLVLVEKPSRIKIGGLVAGERVQARELQRLIRLRSLEMAECAVNSGPCLQSVKV
jgi:hypothetical protein